MNPSNHLSTSITGPQVRLDTLWAHRRLMLLCVLSFLGGCSVFLALRPTIYQASASILANEGAGRSAASQERRALVHRMEELLVRISRLDAEINRQDDVAIPTEIASAAESPRVRQLIDAERLILKANARGREEQARRFLELRDLFSGEVPRLQQRIALAESQEKAIQNQLASIRQLADQKLATTSRILELETAGATASSRRVELEIELLRVQQRALEAQHEIAAQGEKYVSDALEAKRQASADLRVTQDRISVLDSELSSRATVGSPINIADQIEILTSDTIARAAIARAGVESLKLLRSAPETEVIREFRRRLEVKRTGGGSRIDIGFTAPQPEYAASVVDAIVEAYLNSTDTGATEGNESPQEVTGEVIRETQVRRAGISATSALAISLCLGFVFGSALLLFLKSWARGALYRTERGIDAALSFARRRRASQSEPMASPADQPPEYLTPQMPFDPEHSSGPFKRAVGRPSGLGVGRPLR